MVFNIKFPIPMGSYDPSPYSQKYAKSTFSQMKIVHTLRIGLTKSLIILCLADGCSIMTFTQKFCT